MFRKKKLTRTEIRPPRTPNGDDTGTEQEDVDYVVRRFPEEKQVVLSSTVKPSVAFEEGLCDILGVPALKRLDPSGAIEEAKVRMPEPPPSPTPSSALPSAAEAAKAAVAKTAAAKAAATKAAAAEAAMAKAAMAKAAAAKAAATKAAAAETATATATAAASTAVEGRTDGGRARAPPMLAANHIDASGLLSPVGGGVIVPREPRHGSPERAAAAAATAAAAAQEAGFAAASAVALMKPLLPLSQDRPAGQRPRAQLKLLLETRKALSISGSTPATALPRPKSMRTPPMQPARNRAVTDDDVVAPAAAVDTESGLKRRHPTVPGRGLRRTLSIDGLPVGMKFGSGSAKLPARGRGGLAPPPSYSLVEKGVFHSSSASPDSGPGEGPSVEERRASAARNTSGGGGSGSWQKQRGRRGAGTLSKAGAHDDDAASSLGLLSPAASKGGLSAMMIAAVDKQKQKRKPPSEGAGGGGGGAASSTSSLLLGEVVISGSKKRLVGSREDESPRSFSSDKGWDHLNRQQLDLHDKQQRQQREQQQQQQQQAAPGGGGSEAPVVLRMRRCGSTASLREEKRNIPAVLLASLEANGVTLPTPLQESVWSIGRGAGREDLLVHVRALFCLFVCFFSPSVDKRLSRALL